MRRIFLPCLLLFPFSGSVASQAVRSLQLPTERVWTVDRLGGGDFLTIQAAVDAAVDGDTILVRPGSYAGATIDGKELSLFGEPGVDLGGTLEVRNLPSGRTVVLRGLSVTIVVPWMVGSALILEDNAGTVWVEDFDATKFFILSSIRREPQIEIRDSTSVVLVRCSATFAKPSSLACWPSPGLDSERSGLHVFECTFLGSDGVSGISSCGTSPKSGSEGASVSDGFFYASDSSFEGGEGVFTGWCDPETMTTEGGTDGGIGLFLEGAMEAYALGCTFTGGMGGAGSPTSGFCAGYVGPDGESGADLVGPITLLPGTPRSYAVTPAVATTPNATLEATGLPDDLVVTVLGSSPEAAYLALHAGIQLVEPPFVFLVEGTIPANGTLSLPITVKTAPRPMPHDVVYRQGFFFESGGASYLGSASTTLLLPD